MFWLSGGGVRWEFSDKSSSRKFSGPKEQTSCEVLQLEPKWQTTAARMRSPPQHVTWWRNLTAQRAESQNEVKTVGNERWFVSCRYKVELEYPQHNIGREIQVAGFKSSGAPTWRRRRNLRAWIQIKPPTHDETYILPHHASAEHCGVISRYFFQINLFHFLIFSTFVYQDLFECQCAWDREPHYFLRIIWVLLRCFRAFVCLLQMWFYCSAHRNKLPKLSSRCKEREECNPSRRTHVSAIISLRVCS